MPSDNANTIVSRGALPKGAVTRILCLKLDHIGDMLIAAPALMLLRQSFARAHITLICAPWNVALAERLGVADAIHPIPFFAQNSLDDLDRAVVDRRRREAIAQMQALALPPFDLAIDLRRDEDTRPLLKVVEADVRAGFGDRDTFGYLDVALPVTNHGYDWGITHLHLTPTELRSGTNHPVSEDGLHLSSAVGAVELSIGTDAVWPPSDDGQPDNRLLGAALWQVHARTPLIATGNEDTALGPPREIARDDMAFGPGWLPWEPWGRWSSIEEAHLELKVETESPDVELLLTVQGHTSPLHPEAVVTVRSGSDEAFHRFRAGDEPRALRLACKAALTPPTASSEPFLLRAGRYEGNLRVMVPDVRDWQPLTLRVRGTRPDRVEATLTTPDTVEHAGILTFPFQVELRDAAEPVRIEIGASRLGPVTRLGIKSVTLDCVQARSPALPVNHIETLLLDLAAMVALRYAPKLIAPADEVASRLTRHRPGSTSSGAVRRLRARRREGGLFRSRVASRKLVGVAIGSNKETKRWPRTHFHDLCRRLLAYPEVDIVFLGGPAEAADVAALLADLDAGGRALDLCSCCGIEDLGEVLAELDGFVGLDTGTTHFAGRAGLKTVALFGASHDPREWGPVGERSGWIAAELPCAGCFKAEASQCPIALRCMTLLTPEEVWPTIERHIL